MKRFKYSLNKLFKMRVRLEREASQRFSDVTTRIKHIDENIKNLNELYQKNAFATCTTKIDDIIRNNYSYYLENSIKLNEAEREKVQKEYDFRLNDYKEKKKDRKILEKLKEKEYEKFLKEESKEEQDFLDELSINMCYSEFEEED